MYLLLRINLLLTISLIYSSAFSQLIGISAGLNLASMKVEDNDVDYDDDFTAHFTYQFGLTAEFPMNDAFSIETGFLFYSKGFKLIDEQSLILPITPPQIITVEIEAQTKPLYLDIPVNAKYYLNSGNVNLFGTIGPYVGYGLGGKVIAKVSAFGQSEEEKQDIEWGNEDDDNFKRLDYGLNGGIGIEYNSFQIKLGYQYGLANVASYTDNGSIASHRILNFSLLYFISGRSIYKHPPTLQEDPYVR